jgi:hypothetical protein
VVVVTEVVFSKVVVPEVLVATDTKLNTFQIAKFVKKRTVKKDHKTGQNLLNEKRKSVLHL